MKKHIMLGDDSKGNCCILECLLPFDQLIPDEIESSDFKHDATNWGGCDDMKRTLSIKHLTLTGRVIHLNNPIWFCGTDTDMGHSYNWYFNVIDIYEVS